MKMTAILRHKVYFDHLSEIHPDCVVQSCTEKSISDGSMRPD